MNISLKKMFGKKRLTFVVRIFKTYQENKGTLRPLCVFDLRCFRGWGFFVFSYILSMLLQFKE